MMNCYCPYLSRRVQFLHSERWTVLCDDGCFPSLFLWVTAELCGFETILNNSTWAEREPGRAHDLQGRAQGSLSQTEIIIVQPCSLSFTVACVLTDSWERTGKGYKKKDQLLRTDGNKISYDLYYRESLKRTS